MGSQRSEDIRWFTEKLQPHEALLRSYLRGAFPAVRDVDDVVQESFLRIWRVRDQQPIRSTKAFLFAVARRLAVDWLRRGRTSLIEPVPDLARLEVYDEGSNAAEIASLREEFSLLAEAIAALPSRCRTILIMRKFQHLPQKEVARRLGISEETVQEQVYRGMRRCERFLVGKGVIRPWHHE